MTGERPGLPLDLRESKPRSSGHMYSNPENSEKHEYWSTAIYEYDPGSINMNGRLDWILHLMTEAPVDELDSR